MNIVAQDPVRVQGPNVTFVLGDMGNAHVSITLSVGDTAIIKHEETYEGSLTRTLQLGPDTYSCTLLIAAFKIASLGPTYDSSISINGQQVATAKGSIPGGQDSDYDDATFDLIVR